MGSFAERGEIAIALAAAKAFVAKVGLDLTLHKWLFSRVVGSSDRFLYFSLVPNSLIVGLFANLNRFLRLCLLFLHDIRSSVKLYLALLWV